PTPAAGFAMGVERLLELLKASGETFTPNQCDVYIVHQGEAAQLQAFAVAERLRDVGLDVILHCAAAGAGSSFKSQMKRADASGASYALILGEDELARGEATIKDLREGSQTAVSFDGLIDHLVDRISGAHEHDEDCDCG